MPKGPEGKIHSMEIPGDDMQGWITVLREGGFNDSEIDRILSGLNVDYFRLKMTETMKKEFQSGLKKREKKERRKLKPDEVIRLLKIFRSLHPTK